jgi:replicative DNA helicase
MSSNKWTETYRKKGTTMKEYFERDDDTIEKVYKVSTWGPWPGVATEETMKKFRVRVRYSEQTSELIAIYFPAYCSDCTKIVGYQKKDLTIDKNSNYHFVNIGNINLKNPMFFQSQANPSSNHVYICEGPKDALALYQVIHDNTETKWRKFIPPIVSILMGAPNAKMNILHNEHFIKQYVGTYTFKGEEKKKGPILCFDNDESSPYEKSIKGKEATEECAMALSDYYIKILKHSEDMNDIHHYVKNGRQKELYEKAIFQCIEYKPSTIVSLYDVFEPGELKKPIEKGVHLPSYPKLMELLLGDRQGELTLILAPSGVGKTLITADMLYEYMIVKGFCGGVFLEEDLKKTFQRFIARKMQMSLRNFRLGLYPVDDEKYFEAEKWLADPSNFLAVKNDGKIKISELENSIKLFKRRYNRKKVVVDHLMLTQSDNEKKSDLKQLDDTMERIAGLCKHELMSVNLIAHINRGVASDRKRDVTEPTWVRTFKEDARGSSAIECLSYNVICIDIEILPSGKRGRVRLRLDKNREGGDTGIADVLSMDTKTGLMVNAEDWVYDKEKGIMVPPDKIQNNGY